MQQTVETEMKLGERHATSQDRSGHVRHVYDSVWQFLGEARDARLTGHRSGTAHYFLHSTTTTPERHPTSLIVLDASRVDTFSDYSAKRALPIIESPENQESIWRAIEEVQKTLDLYLRAVTDIGSWPDWEGSHLSRAIESLCRVTPDASLHESWTDEKNQRRCQLVDKDIDGTISEEERIELARLQSGLLAYRQKVAPLPLGDLRKMHQDLLQKASNAESD